MKKLKGNAAAGSCVKKMLLLAVCAALAANVFAAGGLKDKLSGKKQQQEQQEEGASEESAAVLMDKLKSMKQGEDWIRVIDIGSLNGKMNIFTIKLIYQLYTRVGGGFIVQTYDSERDTKGDLHVKTISSVFVSDKEMFGE